MKHRAVFLFVLSALAVSVVHAVPVQWSGNGHFYDAVNVGTTTNWNTADTLAQSMTWQGAVGHLVTVTSADEQTFLNSTFGESLRNKWLGGRKVAGTWGWVTGETWSYTNWVAGEPNNNGGDENYVEFVWGQPGNWPLGGWNDLRQSGQLSPYPAVTGFVVEYDQAVPEPASIAVLSLSTLGLIRLKRRRFVR